MWCILCQLGNTSASVFNLGKNFKGLIIYNKDNDTGAYNKHDHTIEFKRWEFYLVEQKKDLIVENWQRHPKKDVFPSQITYFFGNITLYLKNGPTQHVLLEDL